MIQTIFLDGTKYKLSQSDVLGVGGEATVVRVNDVAVKLFHNPSNERTEKLIDFLKLGKLPARIKAPLALAKDAKGQVVGFSMQIVPSSFDVVQLLSSKTFRAAHQYTSFDVASLSLDSYSTLADVHPAGLVVGDLNDLNVLFNRTSAVFIDADSFQFGKHPCMVGTEDFLDPLLYGKQLKDKPYFQPINDWYSWFVMFIRSLLMVHPFGGVHRDYKTIPDRALAKITCLDRAVKYPKVGLHPDLMDSKIKSLFERMFNRGERFVPPKEIFEEYRDSLVSCGHCSTMFPSECKHCPQCSKINTQQIQRDIKVVKKPGKMAVSVESVLTTSGHFVWRRIQDNTIYAIANEKSHWVLYSREFGKPIQRTTIGAIAGHPKFDLFGKYLIVNSGTNDIVDVYDISALPNPVKVQSAAVDSFQGVKMFCCSRDFLFRLRQGFLVKWDGSTELIVQAVSKNQTWIQTSSNGNLLIGFQRFFSTLKFFVCRFSGDKKEQWNPSVTDKFQDDESIIDMSVRFVDSNIFLLIKTEIKGKTFVHCFVIHKDDAIRHYKISSLSSDVHKNIHGKAFASMGSDFLVLHATDEGIVRETIDSNSVSNLMLFSETEPFVDDGDTIDQFRSGILVTGDNQISYLTMA